MTGKTATKFLPRGAAEGGAPPPNMREWAALIGFGAVQWPWLLRSLSGGSMRERQRLLDRLDLDPAALPALGSWKADAVFLHHIVDAIEALRPQVVVELGTGASSLVAARALARNGGGQLVSYDQESEFVAQNREWLTLYGLDADLHGTPMARGQTDWPGFWYVLDRVPARIDVLVIDGPPWTIHPLVRGAAETLFDRIAIGGRIFMDDAARPGERVIARNWQKKWKDFAFRYDPRGTKGTLIGTRIG